MAAVALADNGSPTSQAVAMKQQHQQQHLAEQARTSGNSAVAPSASTSTAGIASVQVTFTSRDSELAALLPSNAFTLPLSVARRQLSEIVHQIIAEHRNVDSMDDEEDDSTTAATKSESIQKLVTNWLTRPFDFVIEGQFLTSDLRTFMQRRDLTGESQLQVEILTALPAPQQEPPTAHPDWIACVDASASEVNMSAQPFILSACYDGRVRVIDAVSREVLSQGQGHTSAVKSVTYLQPSTPSVATAGAAHRSVHHLVSTGADRTVRVWQYDTSSQECNQIHSSSTQHHTDTVECSAALAQSNKFATGGHDNRIILWQLRDEQRQQQAQDEQNEDDEAQQDESAPRKKRKTSANQSEKSSQSSSLHALSAIDSAHSAAVRHLLWPSPQAMYSCGDDGRIRLWSTERGEEQRTIQIQHQTCNSMSYNETLNLLACGSNDNRIRCYDPRLNDSAPVLTLRSHTNTVSGVAFAPHSSHQLASASFDATVKCWDTRASVPLATHKLDTKRLFSCSWMQTNEAVSIFAGGADSKLHYLSWRN